MALWRDIGLTYTRYSQVAASALRECLKGGGTADTRKAAEMKTAWCTDGSATDNVQFQCDDSSKSKRRSQITVLLLPVAVVCHIRLFVRHSQVSMAYCCAGSASRREFSSYRRIAASYIGFRVQQRLDKMVEVKKDENGLDRQQQGGKAGSLEPEQFRKLFIGGLSLNTTDESLHAFYAQYGVLVDCIVMRDAQTKRSRGFGFVSFQSADEVDAAMTARPHTIDGKVVDPKRAVPREQSAKAESNVSTKRLYVSGVRDEHDEETFLRYFTDFGPVAKVEIIQDKNTNKARGFAFVTFDDYDPVDKCVLLKSHMIGGYRCDVKKALSREEMQKAQQHDRDRMERGMRSRGGPPQHGRGGDYGPPPPGYGQYGGGYGAPQPAWGPPPPQWGGYGGGYGGYVQGPPAAASWGGGAQAAVGGPLPAAGAAAAEQGQWGAAAQGWGQQGGAAWGQQAGAGSWGGGSAPGGGPVASGSYGDKPQQDTHGGAWGQSSAAVPGGVPPPQQQQPWGAGRY
uniref:RRM domain-containing protein n=1 Tax=Globodera rostochiensis TaxID=31243 RepID=A0A914HNG6_GLORO